MEGDLVVVVGGTGYLGLHILEALAKPAEDGNVNGKFRLAFTYFSRPPPPELSTSILSQAHAFKVDLRSGEGLDAISQHLGTPRVVINCAAISVPRECEVDVPNAVATNVPNALVRWLLSFAKAGTVPPLLIHLSTDQVYEGTKSFYKEDDEVKPVNAYGQSKVEAEQLIKNVLSNYAILRCSIICGPQPIVPVSKTLPIQWIAGVLASGKETEFFQDEYRCPVFVKDVVNAVLLIMKKQSQEHNLQLLLNIGGPQRLSRAEMAETVAEVKGLQKSLVKRVSASSVNRGVVSPADISMDVSRIISELNIKLTPFSEVVKLT